MTTDSSLQILTAEFSWRGVERFLDETFCFSFSEIWSLSMADAVDDKESSSELSVDEMSDEEKLVYSEEETSTSTSCVNEV